MSIIPTALPTSIEETPIACGRTVLKHGHRIRIAFTANSSHFAGHITDSIIAVTWNLVIIFRGIMWLWVLSRYNGKKERKESWGQTL